MYQMRWPGPLLYQAKFAHLRLENNVYFAHPEAGYSLAAPAINLK
jgi:hypothetical protein